MSTNTKNSYWTPQKIKESRKTAPKEADWSLAGTGSPPRSRTRGGSARVDDDLSSCDGAAGSLHEDSEDSDYSSGEEDDCDDESSNDEDLLGKEKPRSTRGIFEVDPLMDLIERNTRCKQCHGCIHVNVKTTCLATATTFLCVNKSCGYIDYCTPPAAASVPAIEDDNRVRNTDYAINVLFVLGFLSCGDGGKEAARILGLMGLPNDTTMETKSFPVIEERIGPTVRQLTDELLLENLTEEVRRSMIASPDYDDNDFFLWKQAIANPAFELGRAKYPKLIVSTDMGWQQRGSGWRSPSGHAFLVGALTRKPLFKCIKSKTCGICDKIHGVAQGPVKQHICVKNHFGSSGAMEPAAVLEMVTAAFDSFFCVMETIVVDDDASTKAVLAWSNADYKINNNTDQVPQVPITRGKNKGQLQDRPDGYGRLPGNIPEPTFAADPNHRKKLLTGELRKFAEKVVKERYTMTKMDASRIGKNYGYMIRSLARMPKAAHQDASKAVLYHHFDEHKYCGAWCRRKDASAEDRKDSERYYRCLKKDAKLFTVLEELIERFVTPEALEDLCHGMDTQVNESLNNTIAWFAPKNKSYCSSLSLTNRICIALGINSVGFIAYYRRLLMKLGIRLTPDVEHFLRVKDRSRSVRLAKAKTTKQKKRRIQAKMKILKTETATAQKERSKRDGTYRSGRSMAAGSSGAFTEEELLLGGRRSKNSNKNIVCAHCGKTGHSRRTSKACDKYKPPKKKTKTGNVQDGLDADEADAMDMLPFDGDPPSDDDMFLFHDAVESWSDDEGLVRGHI